MDALSKLEEVKRKIATTEARLERAEEQGRSEEYLTSLNNVLIRLYDEKARLEPPTSGQFFGIYSEMYYKLNNCDFIFID